MQRSLSVTVCSPERWKGQGGIVAVYTIYEIFQAKEKPCVCRLKGPTKTYAEEAREDAHLEQPDKYFQITGNLANFEKKKKLRSQQLLDNSYRLLQE